MSVAAIDVGSNTLRLLIGDIKKGRVCPVCYRRSVTRLARGVDETGRMSVRSMEDSLGVLREFALTIKRHGVRRSRAVGTSVLREAENASDFITRVRNSMDIRIETISGEEESYLFAMGVTAEFTGCGSAILFDLGGGSTEMVFLKDKKPLDFRTLPMGVVKLTERHIHSDPPLSAELEALEEDALKAARRLCGELGSSREDAPVLIGTAGTVTTLASIDIGLDTYERKRLHLHEISLGRLRAISRMLASKSLCERRRVRGLEPDRADLILAGATYTIKLMEALGYDRLTVSESGLLEGIVISLSKERGTSAS
jgi:exopolyphosphatase/guanosine-5'-triphosphate,3'-diphosphate pyrophosphatase